VVNVANYQVLIRDDDSITEGVKYFFIEFFITCELIFHVFR